MSLRYYDLDLDHVIMTLNLDLDVLKMYLRIKNEICRSRRSEARVRTGGHTDTLFAPVTLTLTR